MRQPKIAGDDFGRLRALRRIACGDAAR